ncbi:MAG: DUF1549 domain-containing protein [Pirellulaceae bacterium]|jgi:hypothetical protein
MAIWKQPPIDSLGDSWKLAQRLIPLVAWCAAGVLVAWTNVTGVKAQGNLPVPPQVGWIDESITRIWKESDLTPSKVEEDGVWCRRIYLDLLGRIPKFEELQRFLKDTHPQKRQKLVDLLLDDPAYTEEYASRWSDLWTNILIGRAGGTEQNTLTNREGMRKYLRDHFARNKPYDQMVFELITATGTTKPGTEEFNGATNFLAMKVNEEGGVQATAAVSKVFLGLQVQCTQCHNHPFNQWKQQKFWEFNAFFRQTRALRRFVPGTRDIDHAKLINQDFEGESKRTQEADIYFLLRNGQTKVAYPVFVDGTQIERSGYISDVNRREELGKLVLKSEFLDQMIVNRMWAHFLGYGFTKPTDDLGPHNPPTDPELLERLGKSFRESSYDMKMLIRWIVLSKPYQLSSRIGDGNRADDPQSGEPPRFSHFYSRQMGPEELYQSMVAATQADRRGTLEEQQKQRDQWLQQFVVAFGTDDGGETTTFNGSIPQSLMMFNGDLIQKATSNEPGSWIAQIASSNGKPAEKVNFLFLAGLGRRARPEELAASGELLAAREGDTSAMLQDMWWAILNSNEFIINH